MKTIIIIAIFAALALADWPQFKRTPDRQGCDVSENITLPSTLCCWVDFGSPIRAGAAIVNNKAYAISGRGLLARIDLATNTVDWHAALGGVNNEGTPAVGDGKVYVGSTAGKFFVIDAETGAILKEYVTGGAILASPLLFNNSVYFGSCDGVFHALDPDGNLKWTFQANRQIIHSAAGDPATGWIVFTDGFSSMYWLTDGGTQAQLVREYTNPDSWNMITYVGAPMIWNSRVYVGKDGSEGGNYNIIAYNTVTDSVQDSAKGGQIVHGTPSVDTLIDFIAWPGSYDGLFSRLGPSGYWATTGWGTAGFGVPGGSYPGVNSSPAITQTQVIFGSEEDGIHFFRKDSVGYPHPYRANISTGCQLWKYTPTGSKPVEAPPAVSDGKVVVGSFDGCLYGFWSGTEVTEPVIVDSLSTGLRKSVAMPGKWVLTAFPNPSTGNRVNLELAGLKEKASIAIYSVSGALVRLLPVKGAIQWDLTDQCNRPVSSGAYYAVVRNAGGKQMRAFNLQVLR